MHVRLEDYVNQPGIKVTLTTKVATKTGGRYIGNIHCDDMLIGGVGGTADKDILSTLPAKYARTSASLIKQGSKYYIQLPDGTKIEATPLRMS